MKKHVYDLFVPLGANCGASMWLRSLELQVQSYPFDWLTGVGFSSKADVLLNGFTDFLQKETLTRLQKNTTGPHDTHCTPYKNTCNGIHFIHDFAEGKPLDETFPAVAAKYQRRIKRMYRDIQNAPRVLFLWFTRLETEQTPDEELLQYQRKFSEYFGKEIDLLVIENDPAKAGTDQVEEIRLSPHILRYKLDSATAITDEYQVLGNARLVEPVFKPYRLQMPVGKRFWKKIKGPFVRLACLFIFDSERRKKFRQKYFPEYQHRKNLREIHKALKRK